MHYQCKKGFWGWTGTVITSSFPSFPVDNKCSLGSCQSTTPFQRDKFHMKYSPAYYLLNLDNFESASHFVRGSTSPSFQEKKMRKASAGSNHIYHKVQSVARESLAKREYRSTLPRIVRELSAQAHLSSRLSRGCGERLHMSLVLPIGKKKISVTVQM